MLLTPLVCGAALFPGLFYSFRSILKWRFSEWSQADVVCVSERLVSAIHALLATAAGVIVATSCQDVIKDRHWLVNGFTLFGAPYMTFDIYAMYLSHFHRQGFKGHSLHTLRSFLRRDWLLVLHHVVLLLLFMPVSLFLRRGQGDFFIGCIYITELSTPFISMGQILIQLGLDHSLLHRINGLLVLLSFFTCRLLLFPYMYWVYGRQFGVPLHLVAFQLPLHCNLGNLLILAPQLYWFMLLLKKAQRLYRRQTARTRQEGAGGTKTD